MSAAITSSTAAPPVTKRYSRLSSLVLGANPQQRGTVMVAMYASAVYIACLGLVAFFVQTAMVCFGKNAFGEVTPERLELSTR